MRVLVSAMLVVVGLIHILPLAGVLGSGRLAALYGVPFDEPNVLILMRHRAVLFGMVGLFFLYAAIEPRIQAYALAVGFASVLSFLGLAWTVGGYNAEIARVVFADFVALACLGIATAAFAFLAK